MSSASDTIVSGLSTFGKIRVIFTTIILLFVSGFVGYLSYKLITDKNSQPVMGTVSDDSTCNGTVCTTKVTYTYDGKDYTNQIISETVYKNGEPIQLYIDPNNPSGFLTQLSQAQNKKIGYSLLLASFIILVINAIIVKLTFSSKGFAAIEGGIGVVGLLGR